MSDPQNDPTPEDVLKNALPPRRSWWKIGAAAALLAVGYFVGKKDGYSQGEGDGDERGFNRARRHYREHREELDE